MKKNSGQFKPGQSGNPGGRPKEAPEVRELARAHTPDAIKALSEIVKNKKANPSARVSAAAVLLDRGYGRASQDLTVRGSLESHIISLIQGLDDIPDKNPEAATGDTEAPTKH